MDGATGLAGDPVDHPSGDSALSSLSFRFLGVPVEIRASFFLLALILGLQRHVDALLAAWFVVATVAVLVHEAGHAVAFRSFGVVPRVILHGGGGVTMGADPGIHRRIVLTAAGPLAGLLLGVVAVLVARALPPTPTTRALLDDILFATLGWSLINLLPVGGLDGHSVVKDVVRVALGHPAVAEIRVVGVVMVVVLVAGAIVARQYDAAFFMGFIAIMSATPLDRVPGLGSRSGGDPARLLMQGRNDDALAAVEKTLARKPADPEALLLKATALRLMTRYNEAEATYSDLLDRDPTHFEALCGRAMVRSLDGRDAEARADLDAILAGPDDDGSRALARIAALYVAQRYRDGLAEADALAARPGLDRGVARRLHAIRAMHREALGDGQAALADLDTALVDHPDDMVLHEARALTLIGLGRPDAAVRSARRAVDVAPRNPELLETLGIAERFAGRPEAALPWLMDAAAARPELARGRAELSACFVQLGRIDEARAAMATLPDSVARDNACVLYAEACLLGATGERTEAAARLARMADIRPGLARRAATDPVLAWTHPARAATDDGAAA